MNMTSSNAEGSHRRQMRSGTIRRIRELALRHGSLLPGLAQLDCVHSRRSTVMLALLELARVIREYQSDSSSKRPDLICLLRLPSQPEIGWSSG
jgi:hypothetical protein